MILTLCKIIPKNREDTGIPALERAAHSPNLHLKTFVFVFEYFYQENPESKHEWFIKERTKETRTALSSRFVFLKSDERLSRLNSNLRK